jgi:hypothetical protein
LPDGDLSPLVIAGGSIGNITAARVGFALAPPAGAVVIRGSSIGVITSKDGPIGVTRIEATNGAIQGVVATGDIFADILATGGDIVLVQGKVLQGSVLATGGDIRLVDVSMVMRNITAAVQAGKGGNIWAVTASFAGAANTIQISAARSIGTIRVSSAGLVPWIIGAQGGATFDDATGAATAAPLTVKVDNGNFTGTVRFQVPAGVAPTGLRYPDSTSILTIITTAGTQQWVLHAPPGDILPDATTIVRAAFEWVARGINKVRPVGLPQFGGSGWTLTEM